MVASSEAEVGLEMPCQVERTLMIKVESVHRAAKN